MNWLDYYARPTESTVISQEVWILDQLRADLDFLFRGVKSILIHPRDAARERVKFDRAHSGYFHAVTNTVDKILAYPGLRPALDRHEFPLATAAQDRAVLSCDHHALLFASLARGAGLSVRVTTGFVKYLAPGLWVPHWLVEVADAGQWRLVDPERRLQHVPREAFLPAHQAWRRSALAKQTGLPGYSGLAGRQGLKYALVCELNAVLKNELLAYEWRVRESGTTKPEIVHRGWDRLSREQQHDLDVIAELLQAPDEHLVDLWALSTKNRLAPGTPRPC